MAQTINTFSEFPAVPRLKCVHCLLATSQEIDASSTDALGGGQGGLHLPRKGVNCLDGKIRFERDRVALSHAIDETAQMVEVNDYGGVDVDQVGLSIPACYTWLLVLGTT